MKAYKASYNGKCINITYEVGKTYTLKGKIKMCNSGFHFCIDPKDVLNYYPYKKDFVIFEIEVEDNNYLTEGNKSVTNSFKVIRKVTKEEYPQLLDIKVDSKGNKIWYKDSRGYEINYKYNSKGNKVWEKASNGFESNYKYNSRGNVIWYKDSNGFEWNYKYNSKGNKVWEKASNGFEATYQYDLKGNKIGHKDSYGNEWFIEIN